MPDVPESLTQFFEYFWGDHNGYVYLPTKSESGEWRSVMFEWPRQKATVVNHVLVNDAAEKDVYFSPVVFKEASRKKEAVLGSQVLWVDFDGSAPSEWAPETDGEASGQPRTAQAPPPSLRVRSSNEGNQHVYWKLDKLETDIKVIEEKNRGLAYTLQADTSGWDINQVLRPPHTTNYGRKSRTKNPAKPVVIEEESNNVYTLERFSYLKPVKQLVSETISIDSTESVSDILAKYTWDDATYALFKADLTTLEAQKTDRSSALMRLGFYGAEQGMTDAEIFAVLIDADDRWGKFKKRDDRQKRLVDIINRARQKHPHAVSELTFAGLREDSVKIEEGAQYIYGFLDLLNAEFKVEWLFDNLIPKAGCMLLSAKGGVGKTQISMRFGMALALQQNFIGYTPVQKGKTVMFGLEMPGAPTKYFLEGMAPGFDDEEKEELQRHFKFIPLGEPIQLEKPQGRQFFETVIESESPDLVIIDSFGKIARKLQDDEYVKDLFAYLAKIRNKFGCAMLIIHHNRKGNSDNKKPRDQDDVFGSAYVTTEPDVVVTLWQEPDNKKGTIEVREVKNRLSNEGEREPFGIIRGENLTFHYQGGLESTVAALASLEQADRKEADDERSFGL